MEHQHTSRIPEGSGPRVGHVALGGAASAGVISFVAFVTFAGAPHGWLYTAGALLAVGIVATRIAMPGGPAVIWVGTALSVLLCLLGVGIARVAPPTTAVLDGTLDQFEQPGWHLEFAAAGGNLICFDECRSASRTYRVDEPVTSVLEELDQRLTHDGFADTAVDDSYGRYVRRAAGADYLVTVRSADGGSTWVTVSASL